MKPLASISIDMDNKWAYMRAHGALGWESFPSYFETIVPRVLEMCSSRHFLLTAFIVGRDAEVESNQEWLHRLADASHEIGNHSYMHDPLLRLYSPAALKDDLDRSEEALKNALGLEVRGFRGPGFGVSKTLLSELIRRDYAYDASTFPTFIGPLARAAYFKSAELTKAERESRMEQFGKFRDGFQSLKPYEWRLDVGNLVELPVTTMPLFKTPIHFTYLHFLAERSVALARLYFRWALRLCRLTGTRPSILLHPLDFIAADEVPELSSFPGIGTSTSKKLAVLNTLMDELQAHFELTTIKRYLDMHKSDGKTVLRELHP